MDDELVTVVPDLAAEGYTIALDDFVSAPEWEPLLELTHIIKIDLLAHNDTELRALIHSQHSYILMVSNNGVRLLAEKVESEAIMQRDLDPGWHHKAIA